MAKPSLADLEAFKAVAFHKSFRAAADALGVSRSTLSHAMRGLEETLGVRLLHRTTRSVSLTEIGERLLERLSPVLRDLDEVISTAAHSQHLLTGTVRINGSEGGIRLLLQTVVPTFLERHPGVELDLVAEGRLVDIVAQGFDAGVRLGEALPQDMVGVPIGGAMRFLPVASPGYLARHPAPENPADLKHHRCIRQRLPSGKRYRWEFPKPGAEQTVDVPGTLTLDSVALMIMAAADGLGIAYVPELSAMEHLADGRLVRVLEDWCPPIPGLFLYFPANRHMSAGLRAFVDLLKASGG